MLAEIPHATPHLETAIDRFIVRRRPRVNWVQQQSRAAGDMFRMPPGLRNAALRESGKSVILRTIPATDRLTLTSGLQFKPRNKPDHDRCRGGAGCAELAGGSRGGWLGKCVMNVQQRLGHSLVLIFDKYFTGSLWIAVSAFFRPTSHRGICSDGECQMNPMKVGRYGRSL